MLTLGNERILEVPVVFSCNLNCNYCAHLSQYMGHVPPVLLDALEQQFRNWAPRLAPRCIRIIGGEPLLHPNIEQVIELFAKYWGAEVSPLNNIELVTNGMALNKMSARFYNLLEKHNILLRVTLHHANFHDKLHTFLDGAKSRKHVSDYTETSFIQYYHLENGKPHLFTSDSKKSFDSCNIKRLCG
ncbi:MAG: radical SAM protein [Planctomycetaceae bacterium]|nr:radical SAM protein [Planctomycetaceae bacterium]